MVALLNHNALVKHGDFVTELARRQAVGDIDCGFIASDLVEL